MAANATIDFEGQKIKYDPTVLKRWSAQKKLMCGGAGQYEVMDELLFGKSDDIAKAFGDEAQKMTDLLTAIAEKEAPAKN